MTKMFYCGDRAKYNGRPCTIKKVIHDKVDGCYAPVSAKILIDGNKNTKTVPYNDLKDELSFLKKCSGYSHGYANCQVYGISKEKLIEMLSEYPDYEDKFLNGQEEADGSLTFDAYRTAPDDIVEHLSSIPGVFVFAWWHWDGDDFACSPHKTLSVKFDNLEEGDMEDEYLADITIRADDKYEFVLSAGDFTEDDIAYYRGLATA